MNPTPEEIIAAPYVDLLAMLGESNLPPGGLPTVRDLAHNLHLRPGTKALHAGCNTGFLSNELARRTGASITGIDVNPNMAEAGNIRAKRDGLQDLLHYEPQDMRAMTFADGEFDVVLSGGALAFVQGHPEAVAEQIRVTKEFGLLGDVQLYYHEEPPAGLLDKVSEIIEVQVPQYTRQYWIDLYDTPALQPYWRTDGPAGARTDADVVAYCEQMVARCTEGWSDSAKSALYARWYEIFHTFNENMKYMSYTAYVYRRVNADSEPALFI
jgi:ubiquinone/menaquinone biosynthesis C-methylase UbiE